MPRTSTPAPSKNFNKIENTSTYESWKKHLSDFSNRFKIRGARLADKEYISGHINMQRGTEVSHDAPVISRKFLKLLLNQPNSEELISIENSRTDIQNNESNEIPLWYTPTKNSKNFSNRPIQCKFEENEIKKPLRIAMR